MKCHVTPLGFKIPKKSYDAIVEISDFTHEQILELWDILQTDKPYRDLCVAALKYSLSDSKKYKFKLEALDEKEKT